MARFAYDHEILERFPAVVGGVIHADGVANRPATAELTAAYRAEQAAVRERIGDTPLSELPTLTAWRGVFRGFGVNPTKLSLIHISEPTRRATISRMPSSA